MFMIPLSLSSGQVRKSEQKIKIIKDDGTDSKVIVDTVFSGNGPDSLNLRDGSVVYLKHPESGRDSSKRLIVKYNIRGKDNGKDFEELTVVSSDSSQLINDGNSDNVSYKSNGHKYKVITRTSKQMGDSDSFSVSEDSRDNKFESRYVVARNGMVVTIEGNDDAKAKELLKVIENSLGKEDVKK
jgi:hypothetical protein